jgi:hypothetical protein
MMAGKARFRMVLTMVISASEACNEWSLALGTEHGPAFVVLNTILSRTLSDNYNLVKDEPTGASPALRDAQFTDPITSQRVS